MSLGYAEKLSYREDVGRVGMSDIFDPPDVLQRKIEELSMMIQKSKHMVALTGAGISTSCGIPDFRGPKGVWTLQRAGKGLPETSLPFHRAMPSQTHMALVELERAGILKYVISQNVDSLHLRSGIPREKLAELHGNSFMEICPSCGVEFVRDFEIETVGLKETSRRCSDNKCGAKLTDTVLDWEDALPPKEMNPAEKHCKAADLVLCLGTSIGSILITEFACNLPLKCIRNGGKIVIVNLQPTPKDKKASLLIHGLVDKVLKYSPTPTIRGVMQLLNLRIPPYIRIDFIQISLSHSSKKHTCVKWTLRIMSIHGPKAPLPFLKSVEISFPDRPDLKAAFLHNQPFRLKRMTTRKKPFKMQLMFHFSDGCGCPCTSIEWPIDFRVTKDRYIHDKKETLEALRNAAEVESCCGKHAVLEEKMQPKSDVIISAIVTNIHRFDLDELKRPEGANNVFSVTKRCSEGINVQPTSRKRVKST